MTELEPGLAVKKHTAYIQMSTQLLADCAFDLNAVFNPTRRQRIRRRLYAFRGRVAERAYRVIAGRDLPEPEPDWDDD